MNRTLISKRLSEIASDLRQLGYMTRVTDTLDIKRFPKHYENMIVDAALLSEKITCKLRSLVYASSTIRKPEYLSRAADTQAVQVEYQDEILSISLPRLLPRRSGKYSSLFLADPIYAALDQFSSGQPLPKFRECTVCIVHEYDSSCTDRLFFDFDNLQQKQLIDTIAAHVLTDDNAMLCNVFCTSQAGKEDRTRVFIMAKNRFSQWLAGRETAGK